MDTPHNEERSKILPFRPRASMSEATDASASHTPDAFDAGDRVIGIRHADTPAFSTLRALPLGISSGAFFPHVATEDVPAAAARLGVRDLELMLQTAGEYRSSFALTLRTAARDAGTRVHSIHTMHRLHPMLVSYPRRAREERDLFRRGIALAAEVGARVLVWHGAVRSVAESADGWERFIALAHDLAEECGEAGITLGIENVSSCALARVRDVAAFATRLGEIGTEVEIGFVFDPFQAVEAGANPFMLLAAMGNRVVNVHISDFIESDPGQRHLPPGDGDLPWSALIRAIAGTGYHGPLMIEGPLGADDTVMTRIRDTFDPIFRNVFAGEPDRAAPDTDWSTIAEPPAGVAKGIALFNERRFYEQHEEIEHEWHAERGPLRRLYQGLLQIGVGFYHVQHGNRRGAVLLLNEGIAKVSAFTPIALGIDTARLVAETTHALGVIETLTDDTMVTFDPALIPHIHRA